MREILFRGTRSDCGEWIYGYYFKADRHWHGHGIHEDWIATSSTQNGGWCNISGKYPVISETIGQFTGLTDRNGNKVFEGDIVTVDGESIVAAVKYRDDKSAFFVENNDGEDYFGEAETDVIVIGNIYDSPELLEGGDEE